MVKDEEKLEIKVNRLIDRIEELERSLEGKRAQIALLQTEILEEESFICQNENLMPQESENSAEELILPETENFVGALTQQEAENFVEAPETEGNPGTGDVICQEECEMLQMIRDFCTIAGKIIENKDYIEYTYATKYSVSFYKVEQNVFEGYVRRYSKLDLKTFLDFCIDLMILKTEPGKRRCSYYSGKRNVYYVSRNFMDCAVRKNGEKKDAADA